MTAVCDGLELSTGNALCERVGVARPSDPVIVRGDDECRRFHSMEVIGERRIVEEWIPSVACDRRPVGEPLLFLVGIGRNGILPDVLVLIRKLDDLLCVEGEDIRDRLLGEPDS